MLADLHQEDAPRYAHSEFWVCGWREGRGGKRNGGHPRPRGQSNEVEAVYV